MIIMGQATVPSNSTVNVFTIPPGTVSTIVFQPQWIAATPQTVYIGSTQNVSAANGMPVAVTATNIDAFVTSGAVKIWATTGNATASSFSYLISTGA